MKLVAKALPAAAQAKGLRILSEWLSNSHYGCCGTAAAAELPCCGTAGHDEVGHGGLETPKYESKYMMCPTLFSTLPGQCMNWLVWMAGSLHTLKRLSV
jgi:hypothetical protein